MQLVITKIQSGVSKKTDKPYRICHYVNPVTGETGNFFAPEDFDINITSEQKQAMQEAFESLDMHDIDFDPRGRLVM